MRPFSVAHRSADVADATDGVLDVLVIGLGATGAGVALDAASRGMTVAAVDMGDLASGTSSKSSKLVHGGLRYLEQYDFALVREGVVERQLLLRLAPHLVWPMDFVYPVWPDTARRRLLGLGLSTYDVFAGVRNVRRHERVDAEEAIRIAPALADSGLSYAYVYGDSATDDARLVLAIVQAARNFGAIALPYAEVVEMLQDPGDGHVCGVRVRDKLLGSEYEIHARHVVNATGVWADGLLAMVEPTRLPAIQPSKGVHVVVPRDRLPLSHASVLLPSRQGDRRSMFAIAWGPQTILGTTDTAYDGALDALALTEDDLQYVLAAGNAVFNCGLTADDVIGAWVGVRPLLRDGEPDGDATLSDMSRRHILLDGPARLVTITGGKLTTYRRMAKDVVDLLVERDKRRARCRTDEIPLGSTQPFDRLLHTIESAAVPLGIGAQTAKLLARQHGDAAPDVLALIASDPTLSAPLSRQAAYVFAEVLYAARYEGAATLDDVFARRTRLSLRARDAGLPSAARAATIIASEIGRDEVWAREQVTAYADAVRSERGVLGLTPPALTA
ncbi:MAG: glycerol-3-phosphate dehydrogenase/oxidase [Actinomycetes bacterium]